MFAAISMETLLINTVYLTEQFKIKVKKKSTEVFLNKNKLKRKT